MGRLAASLRHYWRANLAVVAGVAVATAVLGGALLVGDSVRSSLRQMTLERLGAIDYALVQTGFVRAQLADELADELAKDLDGDDRPARVAPAILTSGAAVHATSRLRASGVQIVGADERLFELLDAPADSPLRALPATAANRPEVVLNRTLASELGAEVGASVLLHLPRWSQVPRESLLGRTESADVVSTVRAQVVGVIDDAGPGRFALSPHQRAPKNAFVSAAALRRALGQAAPDDPDDQLTKDGHAGNGPLANAILVNSPRAVAAIDAALARVASLTDYGLDVARQPEGVAVTSRELVLTPEMVATVIGAASAVGAASQPVLTHLANEMRWQDRTIPYSTISAIDPRGPAVSGSLRLIDGSDAPELTGDDLLLNDWAAQDLGIAVGDELEVTYYVLGLGEELTTASHRFRLAGVVAMTDLGADGDLSPQVPGVHDAGSMADWDPPFPVDLKKVRKHDEAYWDEWRATPKAFVAAATGQRLWGSRFGDTTAVRIRLAPGVDPETNIQQLDAALLGSLADGHGLRFDPVRIRGLEAAQGATDFAGLFVGFSFFLIAAAVLLVALLFSLGVESRRGEIGLLLAVGFTSAAVRRRFLIEGSILATIGAAIGLVGAVGYSALLLRGLTTWWLPAVGSTSLTLAILPSSLLLAFVIAIVMSLGAIVVTQRRLARASAIGLLYRRPSLAEQTSARGRARMLAVVAVVIALGLLLAIAVGGADASPGLFFGLGAALLTAGLAGFASRTQGHRRLGLGRGAQLQMALAGAARHPRRSALCVALVASACFILVTVAANRREPPADLRAADSPSGGFGLIATTESPVFQPLATTDGRFELGFSDADEALFADVETYGLRLRPGDDASCLNLYRPQQPRLLGVPRPLRERGGFRFHSVSERASESVPGTATGPAANPWQLLEQELEPGVIPAIGDSETVQWILHLGLGEDLTLTGDDGQPLRLRLVAILEGSIFQRELLIGEEQFVRHFPDRAGASFFLIAAPAAVEAELSQRLETVLAAFGFDTITAERYIAGFHAVANTYLMTFLLLGGLGLLLGTVGLAVVLLRNVQERRGELATLRAFGFRSRALSWIVGAENGLLLVLGLGLGTASALVAVLPNLLAHGHNVPWMSLLRMLAAVLLTGLAATGFATRIALRAPLIPALKGD